MSPKAADLWYIINVFKQDPYKTTWENWWKLRLRNFDTPRILWLAALFKQQHAMTWCEIGIFPASTPVEQVVLKLSSLASMLYSMFVNNTTKTDDFPFVEKYFSLAKRVATVNSVSQLQAMFQTETPTANTDMSHMMYGKDEMDRFADHELYKMANKAWLPIRPAPVLLEKTTKTKYHDLFDSTGEDINVQTNGLSRLDNAFNRNDLDNSGASSISDNLDAHDLLENPAKEMISTPSKKRKVVPEPKFGKEFDFEPNFQDIYLDI